MLKDEIIKTLEELNLNEKESKVYLALLETGQSNVTRISSKAEVNRVTTYHLLDSLLKKGLVTAITKDKIRNFQAVEPKRLIEILREKQEIIKAIIPDLEKLTTKIDNKPNVELFEGSKGISALLDHVITNSQGEILSYGNYEVAKKSLEFQSLHYRKLRLKNKINQKVVTNKIEEDFTKDPKWKSLTETRILRKLSKLSTWVFIYGNKVAILSLNQEIIGVILENREIANHHKFMFDMLWRSGK